MIKTIAIVLVLAIVALLAAGAGVANSVLMAVAERTREIGVRMALGAQRSSVLTMVLLEAGKLVLAGVLLGIPASFLSGRLFASLLFGRNTASSKS
jgi:macrolide transport system ATP-binding/permease protein